MHDINLPYWFVWVSSTFGAALIAWGIYQNRITQENKEAIIRIGTNYEHMANDVSDIKEALTNLSNRLDLFLAKEMDFLKSKL